MAGRTGAAKVRAGAGSVDSRYIAEQPADKRALLERLRALVAKALPDADVEIKWGVPVYRQDGRNVCALASFKEHVGLTFFTSSAVLSDPRLEGGGTRTRTLKVRSAKDIDGASIVRWLKAAAKG